MTTSKLLSAPQQQAAPKWRSLLQRIPKSLVLVFLALLVPWLIPGYFSAPMNLDQCWIKQPPSYQADDGFTLTRFETHVGAAVGDGERFCGGTDVPLHLSGSTTLPDDARLWLVLLGNRGQFYLHHPTAVIKSGAWSISNYHPGRDNRGMRLIRVGEATHKEFLQRALDRHWDAFATLPSDARELARLALEVVPVCTNFDARTCVR